MKIIGIGGRMGSGKTTLASMLMENLDKKHILYEHRYFAEPIKKICKELTGIGGYTQYDKNVHLEDFNMSVGELIQQLGDKLREINQNIFINSVFKNLNNNSVLIVSDCRYPREADKIKELGGLMIKIEGDPHGVRAKSKRNYNHATENSLDSYTGFDYHYVNNKSITELRKFAAKVIADVLS